MRTIILLLIVLFNAQVGTCQVSALVKTNYCIVNDKYNEMGLYFVIKKDTAFLFYGNIIDNGNYLNVSADDSTDYAGYFLLKKMKNQKVTFKVKCYRDPEFIYPITLTFLNGGNTCLWNINTNGPVGYLPKKAKFEICPLK